MSFRFVGTALSILGSSTASGLYMAQQGAPGTAHGPPVVVPVTQAPPAASPPMTLKPAPAATVAPAPAPPPAPAAPPAQPRPRFVVAANDFWHPRIFVGPGANINPVTGRPLTRDERESGWVDGPEVLARELTVLRPDPLHGGALVSVKEPNPEVMVLPGIDVVMTGPHHDEGRMVIAKAPAWARSPGIILGPSVEVEGEDGPVAMASAAPTAHPPPPSPPSSPKPAAVPAQPAASPPAPARPVVAAAAAAAAKAGWHIHLASYRSPGRADQGWTELHHALPTVLGSLAPSKVTVTFKGKGTFVRLLAGPFDDKVAADQACAALRQSHQYCHPLAPGRETS